MEELYLLSQSAKGKPSQPQQVLLSHNGNATSIKENTWWKGMFLVPWANRIAYVSKVFTVLALIISFDQYVRNINLGTTSHC